MEEIDKKYFPFDPTMMKQIEKSIFNRIVTATSATELIKEINSE